MTISKIIGNRFYIFNLKDNKIYCFNMKLAKLFTDYSKGKNEKKNKYYNYFKKEGLL